MKRVVLSCRVFAVLAVVGTSSAASAAVTKPFPGVTLVDGGDRFLAIADLCAAGVSVRATAYAERDATPEGWASKPGVGADIAINADFFDFPGWTYVVGRARGNSQDWPAADQNRENREYWQFGPNLAQLVEAASTAPSVGATDIVGGHNVIIKGGKSLAPNFDGDSVITTSHRRTGIGMDAARSKLYLFASNASLDGTQMAASLLQLAAEGGAPDVDVATNQDGGGSSQMFVRGRGQVIDSGRPVNNHLGILAKGGTGQGLMCPNHVPRGAFDAATCDALTGWAQDPDAGAASSVVHLSFDGAAGAPSTKTFAWNADGARPDLVKVVGSPNHGFVAPTPYGIFDGKSHAVDAYAIDTKNGQNPLLGTKTVTCVAAAPNRLRRHVVTPASMKSWAFVTFTDLMPLDDATVGALPSAADLPTAPQLIVADDKSPAVWLVDGATRRHVTSASSAAAWHFDLSKAVMTPAAQVAAMPQGPDLALRPLLAASAAGAIYLLDDPAVVIGAPGSAGSSAGGAGTSSSSSGGDPAAGAAGDGPPAADGGGGCTTSSSGRAGAGVGALFLVAVLVLTRRRRG